MTAEKSFTPFSSTTGTIARWVGPIGHSPIGTAAWSLSCWNTRIRCAVSPASAAGTVMTRSTSAWFVYGSSGDSRSGASLISRTLGVGTGVATSSSMNPVSDELTAPAALLSPPAPT
jgi:hypothetical protein